MGCVMHRACRDTAVDLLQASLLRMPRSLQSAASSHVLLHDLDQTDLRPAMLDAIRAWGE